MRARFSLSNSLILISGIFLVFLYSCSIPEKEKTAKPMVYEGMNADELIDVIGLPSRRDTISSVYQASADSNVYVVHWIYSKRTVVVIGNRVKIPNLERP